MDSRLRGNDDEIILRGDDDEVILRGDDDEVILRGNDDEVILRGNDVEVVLRGNEGYWSVWMVFPLNSRQAFPVVRARATCCTG